MTGLLTAAAVVTMLVLVVSASNVGSKATPSDDHRRGSWGIAHWTSTRHRPLNPHERRWQTVLLSGRDNQTRWRDLVDEISALERVDETVPVGPAPDSFNKQWIEDSIANLESAINDKTQPREKQPGESSR